MDFDYLNLDGNSFDISKHTNSAENAVKMSKELVSNTRDLFEQSIVNFTESDGCDHPSFGNYLKVAKDYSLEAGSFLSSATDVLEAALAYEFAVKQCYYSSVIAKKLDFAANEAVEW